MEMLKKISILFSFHGFFINGVLSTNMIIETCSKSHYVSLFFLRDGLFFRLLAPLKITDSTGNSDNNSPQ